jgi:Ca-activated chloride channel family protein
MSVARQAGQVHVPVYTIALGTPGGEVQLRDNFGFLQRVQVPPDTEGLKQIARLSGGKAFTATEAGKLKEIYAGLGTRLSSKDEKKEVTAAFAGGAIALLIAAGSLSLFWFGRLV